MLNASVLIQCKAYIEVPVRSNVMVRHLRLLFWLGEDNEWGLERSEERRVKKILEVLPKYKDWTPIWQLAKEIDETPFTTTYTALKLMAAQQIVDPYTNEIIAKAPIVNLKKYSYNKKRNATKINYLRAPVYIKTPTQF